MGLEYVAGSYHTFGNNGSVAINGNINDPSNTALAGLVNRTTVLNLLTTVTDHLPVVADYFIVAAPAGGGTVTGNVFFDTNKNGEFDLGELGQTGVVVYLDANSNTQFDVGEVKSVTSVGGSFSIVSTVNGMVAIREIPPSGQMASTANPVCIHLLGGNSVNVSFGNTPIPQLGIAAGAGTGGSPFIVLYNADGSTRFGFYAYDTSFRGGVRVATADINGDSVADIITAPGPGGGPHVADFLRRR